MESDLEWDTERGMIYESRIEGEERKQSITSSSPRIFIESNSTATMKKKLI
jgi:hypothetical protein